MKLKKWGVAMVCVMMGTLIVLSSCARKIVMANTGIAPAAKAYAKVKKERNNNYEVQVKVTGLAPSNKLNPPKKSYVVWMITDNNGTKNIGQFQSSTSLFSNALKGFIKTVTAFKPINFFITAEDDASINYPGNMVILKSN